MYAYVRVCTVESKTVAYFFFPNEAVVPQVVIFFIDATKIQLKLNCFVASTRNVLGQLKYLLIFNVRI